MSSATSAGHDDDGLDGVHESAAASIFGTVVGLTTQDPAAALAAAGASPYAAHMLRWLYERVRRRVRLAEEIIARSGLTEDELTATADSSPAFRELLSDAAEAAEATDTDRKIRHFAQIVSAAAHSTNLSELEASKVVLRTAAALETYDVQVLALIAAPHPGSGQLAAHITTGYISIDELAASLPASNHDLVLPIVGRLAGERLIEDRNDKWSGFRAVTDSGPRWSLSEFGDRFLKSLPSEDRPTHAEAFVNLHVQAPPYLGHSMVVRNLGVGGLQLLHVEATDGEPLVRPIEGDVRLVARDDRSVPFTRIPTWPVALHACWTDDAGRHMHGMAEATSLGTGATTVTEAPDCERSR